MAARPRGGCTSPTESGSPSSSRRCTRSRERRVSSCSSPRLPRWPSRSGTGLRSGWCRTRGRSARQRRWDCRRRSSPTGAPSIRSSRRGRRSPRRDCSRSGSTRGRAARPRSAASPCSASCRGSAPSSCPPGWSSATWPPVPCGGHDAARSPSARSSCRCSASRSSWASTRRFTAAPPRTRPTSRARRPPTRPSPAGTSSASTAWWLSSSTATTGCCAGRRSSCSRSRGSGGCGAPTATGSRAPCRSCARSSSRRACARRRSARSCWWPPSSRPPCSASGSPPATCWRHCRSRSRWSPGASGTRRAWARRWPPSRSPRPPGSTSTSAGAAARS
jgi:hypothetical protein